MSPFAERHQTQTPWRLTLNWTLPSLLQKFCFCRVSVGNNVTGPSVVFRMVLKSREYRLSCSSIECVLSADRSVFATFFFFFLWEDFMVPCPSPFHPLLCYISSHAGLLYLYVMRKYVQHVGTASPDGRKIIKHSLAKVSGEAAVLFVGAESAHIQPLAPSSPSL